VTPGEENDFLGDLRPILADDLASFVPKIQKGRGLRTAADPRDDYVGQEARRFVAEMKADAAETPKCTAMAVVIAERMTGDRGDQRAGVLAAVRFDERGHQGLGAALDELWSVRAKSPRDFWRLVEGAKEEVLDSPSPAAEKGCNCPGTFDVVKRIGPKLTEAKEEDHEPDDEVDPPAKASEIRQAQIETRADLIEIEEAARQLVARRKRGARPSIEEGLIDSCDLADIPPPEWLIEGLIPKAAVGFLSGKYGSYKSFLSVSLACYLAAGKPWQGRDEFAVRAPARVLYVAAEGVSGVAQRIEAWKRVHGSLDRGQLVVYPRPVKLNDPLDVEELAATCREHLFALTIVDTFHRSAPGVEENSSTEFGLVFEAMADIRDEIGMTTLFDDHTGHGGARARGTSAKEDDADFSLLLDLPGEDRSSSAQRTLTVRKFKDAPSEGEWPVRLVNVPDVGPRGSAYLEIGEVGARDATDEFWRDREWWAAPFELPDAVGELRGNGSAVAIDIFRVLAGIDDPEGLTRAEITGALSERPAGAPSKSSRLAAFALLTKSGITTKGESGARVALSPKYRKTS
jgi:hypothetical protein